MESVTISISMLPNIFSVYCWQGAFALIYHTHTLLCPLSSVWLACRAVTMRKLHSQMQYGGHDMRASLKQRDNFLSKWAPWPVVDFNLNLVLEHPVSKHSNLASIPQWLWNTPGPSMTIWWGVWLRCSFQSTPCRSFFYLNPRALVAIAVEILKRGGRQMNQAQPFSHFQKSCLSAELMSFTPSSSSSHSFFPFFCAGLVTIVTSLLN